MSKKTYKFKIWHIISITLSVCVAAIGIMIAYEVRFRNRYELPPPIADRMGAQTISINGTKYSYLYNNRDWSDYLDELPDTFNELSHDDNDIKFYMLEGLTALGTYNETEISDKVCLSSEFPNIAIVYSEESTSPFPNGHYFYMVNNALKTAEVVYKKHNYAFNILTQCYTSGQLPNDIRELSPEKYTVNDDFLQGQPAYISPRTGMIYIEVFEDTVYIPFERPEYIDALTEKGLFGFNYFLPKRK